MKDQVTSIELSKRLIELGVPAEKASMVWEMDEDCARLKIWNTDEETRRILHNKYPNYYVPAFTVADLMGMIKSIHIFEYLWCPCIERTEDNTSWRFEYGIVSEDEDFGYAQCNSLVDLLCDRIEWIVSNGYELNI